MKFFQEITAWDRAQAQNHIYLLNDDKSKMYAYIRSGTTDVFKFKQPIQISTKGRKFVALKDNFNYNIDDVFNHLIFNYYKHYNLFST